MKRQLVIEFPLPPRELSANPASKAAWRKKAKVAKRYRYRCGNAALWSKQVAWHKHKWFFPLLVPATLHLHFYCGPSFDRNVYRPRDSANAVISVKSGQDGLVDAGLIFDDSAKYLKMGETIIYSKAKDHKGRACVEAILEWEDGLDE